MYYFNKSKDDEWLGNPHFDLHDYAVNMGFADLQSAVESCVIASWGDGYSGFSNDDITLNNEGLGFSIQMVMKLTMVILIMPTSGGILRQSLFLNMDMANLIL